MTEVADLLKLDRAAAEGLVKALVGLGLAKDRGTRTIPRGRCPRAYALAEGAAEGLLRAIRKLPM